MLFICVEILIKTEAVELHEAVELPDMPSYATFCKSVGNNLRVSNGNLEATKLTGGDVELLYLDFVMIYNNAKEKMDMATDNEQRNTIIVEMNFDVEKLIKSFEPEFGSKIYYILPTSNKL